MQVRTQCWRIRRVFKDGGVCDVEEGGCSAVIFVCHREYVRERVRVLIGAVARKEVLGFSTLRWWNIAFTIARSIPLLLQSASGRRAVCFVTLPGEKGFMLRPGGFSVKAVVRSHDLSHSAPLCIATCIDRLH